MFLFVFDQGVGNPVEELLCAFIAKVLEALASKTVMDRKTNTYQWNSQSMRDVISLAISDHQVGF
jgi:hypothetical protein